MVNILARGVKVRASFGDLAALDLPRPAHHSTATQEIDLRGTCFVTRGNDNSGAADPKAVLSKEELRKRAAVAKQVSSSFADIVTMLMRSETERKRTLADLEWMVVPAMQTGQFAVAESQSQETGVVTPMAVILWAMVSDEVDRRLTAEAGQPLTLAPTEWRSGTIPWIVAAFGDTKVVGQLFEQLSKNVFTKQPAKLRARDKDGKPMIGRIEFKPAAPTS
jgi:hemolysin-activating ACP:hemolysin acyltransferase